MKKRLTTVEYFDIITLNTNELAVLFTAGRFYGLQQKVYQGRFNV